jgi:hypothetical protein
MNLTIRDQEALKERARFLYTVPEEILLAAIDNLGSTNPCKAALLGFYVKATPAAIVYELINPVETLSDLEKNTILACLGRPNGISLALVKLVADKAELTVLFYNTVGFQDFFDELASLSPADGQKLIQKTFPIFGGYRVRGGSGEGQVHVEQVVQDPSSLTTLKLTVTPIGDYSTYTLGVVFQDETVDPVFGEIDFKFRPGCFNNCPPELPAPLKPKKDPTIDYLAKDYDSFRHTLLSWMSNHVPGWEPTSEADLDQVLLELFSVAADELSDYQDRVMNEAYLSTVRKRVSLARFARLMDYHIHQGNQASTWLALEVASAHEVDTGFKVWSGEEYEDPTSVVFITHGKKLVDPRLNTMGLYTWSGATPALSAGATQADIQLKHPTYSGETNAKGVQNLIRTGKITHLLIQEQINPLTGEERGRDPGKRQLLHLLLGEDGAEARKDPVNNEWFVRVRWIEVDKLKNNYCFTIYADDKPVENVSLFHGNLVQVHHGRPQRVIFKEPGQVLAAPINPNDPLERHFERTKEEDRKRKLKVICRLPGADLAYKNTPPGGEVDPRTTLSVNVNSDAWNEVISLIHSDDSAENGDHFIVETDELGRSAIVFGDGRNGRQLPEDAVVTCDYQVGKGLDGNVGSDTLVCIEKSVLVTKVWNPFDVINGRALESRDEIVRRVPQAYRYRQLRAVTLQDYVDRAEELDEVSRAAARYMWTGSWPTVRVAIDPVGSTILVKPVRDRVSRHLEAVRLIGEDLEIRPPRFVPLEIRISLCVDPDYWPQDIQYVLEEEFSEGYTSDGRISFFHPDLWTFGQKLRASQIIGRAQGVQGVDHVIQLSMKRWGEATLGTDEIIEVQANEIVRVRNDPDHMEQGFIKFELKGGR